MRRADVPLITRELMLAAVQLPLAAFIAGTANAQSPQDSERLEALIRAQAAQIERLSLEMKALKKAQSKTSQQAQSNTPQPAPTAPRPADKPLTSQQAQVAPRPAVKKTPGAIGSPQYPDYVSVGDKALTWKLPGSDVSLRIGGYAKLDAIGITGGNRTQGSSDEFIVPNIQTRGTPATGNTPGDPSSRIHARQSRFFVEASKTDTPFGPARAYIEADFFGPTDLANETASNSSTFRVRHAYGEMGPLLAGQNWGTFVDPTTYPEVLDFEGPGAEPSTAAVPVVPGDGRLGFGVLASGQIALPLFNKKDNFRFQATYLDGASRYILNVGESAPSVAYNATLTDFDSVKAYGAFGALQHWWTDTIRSNFVYSFVQVNNPVFSGPAVLRGTQYGVVNLIYSPWPDVDIGAEFQYGQRTDADGRKGNQTRIQSSLIYRF